jgi:hypothetical protein
MYLENDSYKMNAHHVCLYTSALRTMRGSGRESVPLHCASRHAWTDITPLMVEGVVSEHVRIQLV